MTIEGLKARVEFLEMGLNQMAERAEKAEQELAEMRETESDYIKNLMKQRNQAEQERDALEASLKDGTPHEQLRTAQALKQRDALAAALAKYMRGGWRAEAEAALDTHAPGWRGRPEAPEN